VSGIVAECTDYDPAGERPPWRERKKHTVAVIQEGRHTPSGLRVSLADKLNNARAVARDHELLGEAVWERFSAGRDEQLWYLRALADAFAKVSTSPMARELDAIVGQLEGTS